MSTAILAAFILTFFLGRVLRPAAPRPTSVLAWSTGWVGLIWLVGVPGVVVLARSAMYGVYSSLGLLAFLLVLLVPWQITRLVLIPLGLPRLAYWMAKLALWTWGPDRTGGPALAAAWALLHRRAHHEKTAEWLEDELHSQLSLLGGGVVAFGLLAASRGDRETARALMESIATFDPRVARKAVRRVAADWLVADAAAAGDWKRLARMSERPASRTAWLMAAVAARLLGEAGALSSGTLWWMWLMAPRRRWTYSIVRRAAAVPPAEGRVTSPAPERQPPVAEAPPGTSSLDWALSQHLALLSAPPGSAQPEALAALGRAWDAALADPALRSHLAERAARLGEEVFVDINDTLRRIRGAAEADLGALIAREGIELARLQEPGELLDRVAYLQRERILSELELAASALARRRVRGRAQWPVEELREWLALRALYERAAATGGLESRRVAFAVLEHEVCNLGVWLFNVREEKPLANALFRWLAAEAEAVGAAESARVNRVNAALGF